MRFINWIILNFDSDYNWSKDKNNSIIKNNKTDFIFIKIDDAIIGYVHIIKITYDKYYEMVHCKRYVDIDSIDIKRFSKKRRICTLEFSKKSISSDELSDNQYYKDDE